MRAPSFSRRREKAPRVAWRMRGSAGGHAKRPSEHAKMRARTRAVQDGGSSCSGVDDTRYVSYPVGMIRGFANRATERFFREGVCPARWRSFERSATYKLDMLAAATGLDDLRSPPGNRLEALKGDRKGFWSIRINSQWRICFRWTDDGPSDVEILDYH